MRPLATVNVAVCLINVALFVYCTDLPLAQLWDLELLIMVRRDRCLRSVRLVLQVTWIFVFRSVYTIGYISIYSVNKNVIVLRRLRFDNIFPQRQRICNQNFTCLLYAYNYAKLQNIIQLSLTLTCVCHIKCNCPVNFFLFSIKKLPQKSLYLCSVMVLLISTKFSMMIWNGRFG